MSIKKTENPIKTVLIISMGFGLVYFFLDFRWALIVSLFIGVLGLVSEALSKIIDFLWMKLAYLLSLIVPNILLGTVFYVFLFPIALLYRILGKESPLFLKNNRDTLFVECTRKLNPKSFEKPW